VEKALGLRASDGEGTERHFVVLHVMGLHPPYRWSGPECTPQPGGVLTEEWLPLSDYFDAARCATRRTLESIDLILAQDPTAVVIVQGDHGPGLPGQICRQSVRLFRPKPSGSGHSSPCVCQAASWGRATTP